MGRTVSLILSLGLCSLAGPVAVLAQAAGPSVDGPILVIGPNAVELVARTGGQIVGPTVAPLAVLATGNAQFLTDLDQSRAWLVTDARWLVDLCGY